MYNSQEVANKIKSIAKEKSIAVGKMLADCEISKNALSSMQSGGFLPRLENIIKIADYLDCSIDSLLGRNLPTVDNNMDSESMYNTQHTVELIKSRCKTKGIQVGKMLADCELSKNALSSMQSRGSWLQANNLAKIADYLDCSVDYLLGRTDNPEINKTEKKKYYILDNQTSLVADTKKSVPATEEDDTTIL